MPGSKASSVKWASALSEMGFSKDQVEAALHECKSLRQAVEWLCSQRDAPSEVGSDFAEVLPGAEEACSSANVASPGTPPRATSSANKLLDMPDTVPQGSQSRCAPMSPMWVAMKQRFNENVSALKSRQGRKSYAGRPPLFSQGRPSFAGRRHSLRAGPVLSHTATGSRGERGPRQSIQPNPSKRRSMASSHQDPDRRAPDASVSHCPAVPPQPLPTPEAMRSKKRCSKAKGDEVKRRSIAGEATRHGAGKTSQQSLDEHHVVQLPTPSAQAPNPDSELCDYCSFRKKRLRSKTPEPADGRCRQQRSKRLSRKSSPSVERLQSGCTLTHPASCAVSRVSDQRRVSGNKTDERRTTRSNHMTSEGRALKSYRVKWAWKLSEMGFSDDQIDAAVSRCSTQREAIEWLCHSESAD